MLFKLSKGLSMALLFGALFSLLSCREKTTDLEEPEITQSTDLEQITLQLQISKSSLKTNEVAVGNLSISHAPDVEISLPELAGNRGDFFISEVLHQPAQLDARSWVTHRCSFTLEPDLPGLATLPALEVLVKNQSGETQKVHLAAPPITVLTAGVTESTELRDIAADWNEQAELPQPSWNQLWTILPLLALAVIASLIFLRSKTTEEKENSSWHSQFLALKEAPEAHIARKLEATFCRAFSELDQRNFKSLEFSQLCADLDSPPAGLVRISRRYESLKYSKNATPETDKEIADLYPECVQILAETKGKAMS